MPNHSSNNLKMKILNSTPDWVYLNSYLIASGGESVFFNTVATDKVTTLYWMFLTQEKICCTKWIWWFLLFWKTRTIENKELEVNKRGVRDVGAMDNCSPESLSWPALAVIFFIDLSHSERFRMESQSSFVLHFPEG